MNTNDNVSVRLTRHGFDTFLRLDIDGNLYKHNYDAVTNTLTIPLWKLMNIFGKYIYVGSKQIFEDNEILIENDNKTQDVSMW